jgi:hypothetical protein
MDAAPSGKKFQGVWLEMPNGKRWVIDYRPRELWKSFVDADVLVTGECYEPFGQAIMSPHFRVDRMRFAAPRRGTGPLLELGAEVEMHGELSERGYPAGSKLEGSSELVFHGRGSQTYGIAGASTKLEPRDTPMKILAREVTPDLSYTAQTGGPKLWILDVRDADSASDPAHAPRIVPCPSD